VIRPIRRDAAKNSVNGMNVSVLAGMISTGLFAVSYLPMMLKALLVPALPDRIRQPRRHSRHSVHNHPTAHATPRRHHHEHHPSN
jgi:hypothetical protein